MKRSKPFERIILRDFGCGHVLEAIWHKDIFVGHFEYGATPHGDISKIYALILQPRMRGKGYGTRIMLEIVKNPSVKLYDVKPESRNFWGKFVQNIRNNKVSISNGGW